jgi:hypothetical protein
VPSAAYCVVLSRADRRPTVDVWPMQLRDSLPMVPVPLLEPDPDVPLDAGAAVASGYERGGYGSQIDYQQPPRRWLSPAPRPRGWTNSAVTRAEGHYATVTDLARARGLSMLRPRARAV